MNLLLPVFTSIAIVVSLGAAQTYSAKIIAATSTITDEQTLPIDFSSTGYSSTPPIVAAHSILADTPFQAAISVNIRQTSAYIFGNPAGCANTISSDLTVDQMLTNVQAALGNTYSLPKRRVLYVWNGPLSTYMDVTKDPYVYEYTFNEFEHPLTYRADPVVTIFLNNGFVVWLRSYGRKFRLTAIPMTSGVFNSAWSDYVTTYWRENGKPNDEFIYPVMKKLPCHWVIDASYVSNETLRRMFNLDWHVPDYLSAGRQYLAETCKEAYRISREKIGYPDASTMCGPLAWTITRDVNGFPYRIGSWSVNAGAFTGANPKWNGQPWGTFDPNTFTLMRTDSSMPGYDFEKYGNLYPGDLIYSYATLYVTPGYFDHIFLVAGIDENNTRLSITNMIRNAPYADCSIAEIPLYTSSNRENGVINHEWNGFGFGQTGTTGFDVFRWNWITYHINAQPIQYTVRWGDTLETIAFDWKVSPDSVTVINHLTLDAQLIPGQIIQLPNPEPSPNLRS